MPIGVAEGSAAGPGLEAAGAIKVPDISVSTAPEIAAIAPAMETANSGDTFGAIDTITEIPDTVPDSSLNSSANASPWEDKIRQGNEAWDNAGKRPAEGAGIPTDDASESHVPDAAAPEAVPQAANGASATEDLIGPIDPEAAVPGTEAPATSAAEAAAAATGEAASGKGGDGDGAGETATAAEDGGAEKEQPDVQDEAEQVASDTERNLERAEYEDLQGKYDRGDEDMTAEQLQRLDELKAKDPDAELAALDKKHENKDEVMTIDEYKRRNELKREKTEREAVAAAEPGAEKTQEQIDQEINDLGTEINQKMVNGGYESIEEMEADVQKLQDKMAEGNLQELGFTEAQSREAVKKANETGIKKETRGNKDIQDKIQQLMVIEHQILTVPAQVKAAREKRDAAITKAQELHDVAQSKKADSPERLQAKAQEYNQYMVVDNYNVNIQGAVNFADRLNEDRRNLEQQVRSQLGVTGKWGALMEWGANQAINTVTELRITAAESVPWSQAA